MELSEKKDKEDSNCEKDNEDNPEEIYENLIQKELRDNFQSRKEESHKINQKIVSLLDEQFQINLYINPKNVSAKNFIFTKNAIQKLKEIKYYISHNYPILLEGPTGTAKTKSVEIICEEMGLNLKRFNLSSETKTADLFGRYVGDSNSFSGISFQEGIFIEAFKNGDTLLLDEINLASNQVLQSFEECLDNNKISCEIPGMPWKEIQMGKGFNLIATQNPNKGLFANKRQELGKKFLSRFHIINFESFQKEELYQIAEGLGKNHKIDKSILKDLVNFHDEWSKERKDDILCFTIREIEATINAISKGEGIQEAILCIYGSRYKSEEYNKLKAVLNKYPKLNSNNDNKKLSFDFKFLKKTPPLEKVLRAIQLSFENNRHVMITGDEETGKSQIARYIAEERDKKNDENFEKEGIYYCQCTEDLKCSDLIGNQYPSLNSENDNFQQLMKWEDGFLTLSIINGKCCILDNIEEAPATITERLNGLLDKKLDVEKDLIFEIPECPLRNKVEINKNFRLLCICNYESLSKMSPSFLNRFDIITLEDQIKPYLPLNNNENSNNFLDLIDKLVMQHSFIYNNNNINKRESDEQMSETSDIIFNNNIKIGDIKVKKEPNEIDFIYDRDYFLNRFIFDNVSENINEIDLTMYKLSLFCRASYIFNQEINVNQNMKVIEEKKIVDYAFKLTLKKNNEDENIIEGEQIIEDFINNIFLKESSASSKEKFYFLESQKLKSFMAQLYAFSMINLHVCIIGETGIGKTSCAREFGRIRAKNIGLPKEQEEFYMHSFHSNTKSSHFYGNLTMKNNEIEFINGSLLNAMEKGITFIADEKNLSP